MNFHKQLQQLTSRAILLRDIKSHIRINDILLGPLERPALRWLAAHMPGWVTPDMLTAVGVLGSVVIFISYWLTNLHPAFLAMASLGFVINWFGDSLDGTLARFRKIERPRYGFFIDHSLDAVSVVLVFLGLGISPYVRFEIATLALIGYLLMSIHVYVRTCVNNTFKISYAGLGPTEARVIAILLNTTMFFVGRSVYTLTAAGGSLSLTVYDIACILIGFLLLSIFSVATYQEARSLSNLDK